MARTAQIHGVAAAVRKLRGLPKELSAHNGGPIRKAAFQGAKVFEEKAKIYAPVDPATESDIPKAIVKRRHPNPKSEPGSPTEIYRVGVDNRKAYYWHFLEFGTVNQPAQPFLRVAFDLHGDEAVDRFVEVFVPAVEKLERSV